jgi:hypothetical protein
MTTTRRSKDPAPGVQLALPHTHRWQVATLATPGLGTYAATCSGCGHQRSFPTEPVVRSITINPRREDRQ